PRITGASSITNHAVFALADVPLFLFHIMEWMDRDYELSINAINQRWHLPENIDSWGQMVIKHTDDSIRQIKVAPRSGIYSMDQHGKVHFDRMDTHRRAVEKENEAFFLRIMKAGDYLYEGADLGILVMRGRMMTDDFQLNDRSRKWIDAIRNEFKSTEPTDLPQVEKKVAEIGGFKMM
ncbi:MAG: biotin carboxylase, partial [Salibacteraceae bacterium]